MFDPEVSRQFKDEVRRDLGAPGRAIGLTDAPDLDAATALDAVWAHWLDCTATMQELGFAAEALCEGATDIERIAERTRQAEQERADAGQRTAPTG